MVSEQPEAEPRTVPRLSAVAERRLIFIGLALAALVAFGDQWSKVLVERHLSSGRIVELIPGFFSLRYTTNYGAAWGMMSGYGWLLLVIGVAVLAAAMIFLRYLTEGYIERYLAIFTIAGGVIGNSIDRMWRGHVVDFLAVDLQFYHWPIFNLADCAICVGVGLFLLSVLLRKGRDRKAAQP